MDKDKLALQMVRTMLGFVATLGVEWDETYLRITEHAPGAVSSEWLYRKDRALAYFDGDDDLEMETQDELEDLGKSLFETIEEESRQRPVVLVLKVDRQNNYKMQFDYANPKALAIALLSLRTSNSYFGAEVDIPDVILKTQQDLTSITKPAKTS